MLELLGFYRRTGFCRFLFHRHPITPSGQGHMFLGSARWDRRGYIIPFRPARRGWQEMFGVLL